MQRVLVESSTLGSAGHDAQSAVLELQFRNGAIYQYFLVPPSVYRDLLGARSKGGYFNQNIRGRYPYQRVHDTLAPRP
ncbi:MAG: KTSC domain-containing protein [Gammaproteobacteria bacterium]